MHDRLQRTVPWLAIIIVCLIGLPSGLCAQEQPAAEELKPDEPFVVVAVAGIERMLGLLDFSFETVDRPEASEAVGGFLSVAGGLKGIDHDRSFGVMIFLAGIQPQPVGFVPIDQINDLMKTIEIGPFTTKKAAEDRYELKGPRMTIYLKTVGRYAFVSTDEQRLERTFPDPAKITSKQTAAYDISATLNFSSLPQTTKDLLATLIQGSADANLQRRDGEDESAHRIRKAAGENNARLIRQVVRDADEVTLGWKTSPKQRHAALELTVRAVPGSELATLLGKLNTVPSQFAALRTGNAPLTFAGTFGLDKHGKRVFTEIIDTLESSLSGADAQDKADDSVAQLFRALRTTIDRGSLDFAFRFVGEPPGPMVLVGGLKVADGQAMAEGLADLCAIWMEGGDFEDGELDMDQYGGVSFHRLEPKGTGEVHERLYGGKPSLYLGVGAQTFWMAMGGDEALPTLYEQIDALAKPVEKPVVAVPLEFVANISSWLSLRREVESPGRFRRTVDEAFSSGKDSVRLDFRPIKNGARLRLQLDEGFIRFLGIALARRFTRE